MIGRRTHRHHHPEKDPEVAGAVDPGRLFDLAADAQEELPEEEDGERGHEEERQNDPGQGIDQTQLLDQQEVREAVKIGGTIKAARNSANT